MSAARLLAALAVRIAPADRKDWAEALLAELAHVPPAEVTAFAAGGLLAALRLRLTHPAFVLVASRYGLAAGALLWAALHLRLFLHLQEVAPGEAAVRTYLLVTTAIFALGGLITAAAGLRFTCLLGLPMLGLAALYTAGAGVIAGTSPNAALYQALAVEDLLSLVLAVAIAAAARGYARRAGEPA